MIIMRSVIVKAVGVMSGLLDFEQRLRLLDELVQNRAQLQLEGFVQRVVHRLAVVPRLRVARPSKVVQQMTVEFSFRCH